MFSQLDRRAVLAEARDEVGREKDAAVFAPPAYRDKRHLEAHHLAQRAACTCSARNTPPPSVEWSAFRAISSRLAAAHSERRSRPTKNPALGGVLYFGQRPVYFGAVGVVRGAVVVPGASVR
jgi:hypothetical protein